MSNDSGIITIYRTNDPEKIDQAITRRHPNADIEPIPSTRRYGDGHLLCRWCPCRYYNFDQLLGHQRRDHPIQFQQAVTRPIPEAEPNSPTSSIDD